MLCEHEHGFGYNPLPNTVQRHRVAAERAIALDARSPHAWAAMVTVHLFAQDLPGVRAAVERVASLNPLNADLIARSALFLDLAGDHDRALALTNDAIALKPQHPASYHFVPFNTFYARGDDERALEEAKLLWMPKLPVAHMSAAAAAGQLGRAAEARVAINALRQASPGLVSVDAARAMWSTWMWNEPFIDRLVDGFSKALALSSLDDGHPSTVASSKPPSSQVNRSARGGSLTVAVLPFVPRSSDDDSKTLADGLTDDITSGLSRFGYLQVLSRSISERLAREHTPVNTHARYALEGNVRKSGTQVRVGITLVDTLAGTNLWTQNYDRDAGGGMFSLQDDVTSAAVATIGDQTGVLVRAMAASMADTPIDQLSVAELVIRYHLYAESFRPDEHLRLRDAIERALDKEPRAAEGWACLAMLCEHEHGFGLNRKPDPLVRQRRAAERAVELDPRSQMAWIAIASVHGFARDLEATKSAIERAVSINPLNADLVALASLFLSFAGQHDRAHALVVSATARKPQHAGWYHFPICNYHIARGDFESALREVKAINMPMMPLSHLAAAAVSGHLGRAKEAGAALASLRQINPALAEPEQARALWSLWLWDDRFFDTMEQGFRKAIAIAENQRPPSSDATSSIEPSIAVLPFADLSEKKDQDWFCDGIAEEILTALASLPGLRVAARASAFSLRGTSDDLEAIGEKLNVNTVLEGSVRRAGDRVRITARLSDTQQGRQLWSERFDRELKDIFDVQDEIARAIAERLRVTIAGRSARLVQQTTTNIEAYELLLKGRAFLTRRGRAVLDAIPLFERAIALDANLSEAHALLGDAYRLLGLYGIARASEVMPKARACIDRALAIDPNQAEALATLAIIASVYEWDIDEVRRRSDRAIAADPTHVRAHAERAISLACLYQSGSAWHEEVRAEIATARALDPLNAWVIAIEGFIQSLMGQEAEAVASAKRAIELDSNNFTAHWALNSALARFGHDDLVLEAAVPALAMSGRHTMILAPMAAIYADRGQTDKAELIRAELEERAATGFIGDGARAAVAAAAGRWSEARSLLAKAIDGHDPFLTFWKLRAWQPIWKDEQCAAMIKATSLFRGPVAR
jgi:TolB-like protein/Tfp pilus assembly protein PilF